MEQTRRPDSIR
uniref:Uncharacterized protein n=1 Tax=Rhizophora mucronata TaxID=61149 RepID=A0A2P2IYI7_RHIMU